MLGVTFNDRHSFNDLGLLMNSDNRSLRPSLKKKELEIAGRHGTWDFDDNTYEVRSIKVTFYYPSYGRTDLRIASRRIAQWLDSRKSSLLTFDDEPDKHYYAKVYSAIDPKEIVNDAEFTVEFICQPLAELKYFADEVILDTDIVLDGTDIRLFDEYTYQINQLTVLEINNFGTVEARPEIIITGSFTNVSININGRVINYTESINNSEIKINNENYTIYKDTTNKLNVVTGNLNTFLELQPGINSVTIDGLNLNCTVTFKFKPKYL